MLINFFYTLREFQVPVTIREFLDLLKALRSKLAFADQEQFYFLARACLVKDEKFYDKFDQAFAAYFEGIEANSESLFEQMIPDEWLRKELEKMLTKEQMEQMEAHDFEKLMDEFRKRLEEQKKRHQGGNKWIGTGGTSPFGAYGYNPSGVRIGGLHVINVQQKCGRKGRLPISMIRLSWVPATSKWL